MLLCFNMIKNLMQEEQRNTFVEDEDNYFGDEVDEDLRDGMVFKVFMWSICWLRIMGFEIFD